MKMNFVVANVQRTHWEQTTDSGTSNNLLTFVLSNVIVIDTILTFFGIISVNFHNIALLCIESDICEYTSYNTKSMNDFLTLD